MAKLRRALAEADESVVTLTRRTAEEMAAVAERLAAGLRGPTEGQVRAACRACGGPREADRLRVRLAEAEARAAAAEHRLEEMGGGARERQTALEDALERLRLAETSWGARVARGSFRGRGAKAGGRRRARGRGPRQGARRPRRAYRAPRGREAGSVWRLAELEDKLRDAIARAVRTEGAGRRVDRRAPPGPGAAAAGADAGDATARERALDEFHQAAAAHVAELTELKASVAEQSALVAELEDAVEAAEARRSARRRSRDARKTAKDLEEADRSRRSRLAELEGKLLRLEHERKAGRAPARVADESDAMAGRASGNAAARRRDRASSIRRSAAVETDVMAQRPPRGAAQSRRDGELGVSTPAAAPPRPTARGGDAESLESTLGNYRERAGRLRDELEGIRRRLDSLSSSEIAGFLEELGDDLAELGNERRPARRSEAGRRRRSESQSLAWAPSGVRC